MKKPAHIFIIGILAVGVLLLPMCMPFLKRVAKRAIRSQVETKSVAERLEQYGGIVHIRLKPRFDEAKVIYPPKKLTLVGLKDERTLQVYALDGGGAWQFIRSYPILGASGGPGPKLHEGDFQVPEGIYPIDLVNPNSSYHLSLRVGYPNMFDQQQAAREGRTNLGGDIMIHGSVGSVGCLAMGDEAAEDLFVLAADTGLQNISVILAPVDFREGKTVPKSLKLPHWTEALYADIKTRLAELPSEKK